MNPSYHDLLVSFLDCPHWIPAFTCLITGFPLSITGQRGDHTESVRIEYDPEATSYKNLLEIFWKNHDPTSCQKRQYMSAIFYHDEEQKQLAEETKVKMQKCLAKPVATKILPAEVFYIAEMYHQKYMLQNHSVLFKSLCLENSSSLDSYVATRLNGYLGGYGTLHSFEREWEVLKISEEQADYIRQQIIKCRTG